MTFWEDYAQKQMGNIETQDTLAIFVAIQANTEQQERAANALEILAGKRHLEVLEEIRDLARTGLPIQGYEQGQWDRHRLNRIADIANNALGKAPA